MNSPEQPQEITPEALTREELNAAIKRIYMRMQEYEETHGVEHPRIIIFCKDEQEKQNTLKALLTLRASLGRIDPCGF